MSSSPGKRSRTLPSASTSETESYTYNASVTGHRFERLQNLFELPAQFQQARRERNPSCSAPLAHVGKAAML